MCGIAGIYNPLGVNLDETVIRRMAAVLAHRGPDAEGFLVEPQVHLTARRLAIIDPEAGPQPLTTEDGRFHLVFNGEIYNFRRLRRELADLGRYFTTRTDTEVLLEAFAVWGPECFTRFKGMFAAAIWDKRKSELTLVRDKFGIKPLYTARMADGSLVFGSEIKAILGHPLAPRELNPAAIDNLFSYGFNPAPGTFFRGIDQLLPGHYLVLSQDGVREVEYWDIDLDSPLIDGTLDELAEEFREKLSRAVELGLVADVPVASYLSGGIDSSAITGLYASASRMPIKTVSIVMEEAGYDESGFARLVSRYNRTDHTEFTCSIDPGEIRNLIYHLENPIVSLLNLPLYLLSKKAREIGVKVALAGDGADEIIGGYDYFRTLKAMAFIGETDSPLRRTIMERVDPQLKTDFDRKLRHAILQIRGTKFPCPHPAMPYRYSQFQLKEELYSNRYVSLLEHSPPGPDLPFDPARIAHRSLIDQALYIEIKMRLLSLTLPLSDKMGMANSIELRPLILDDELVDFLFRLPDRYKIHGMNEKYLFRRSMAGLVPDEVRARTKQPLQPPAGWFIQAAGDLLEESLSPEKIKEYGYFDPEFVARARSEYEIGGRIDYSGLIVVIFFVQLWHEIFLRSGRG